MLGQQILPKWIVGRKLIGGGWKFSYDTITHEVGEDLQLNADSVILGEFVVWVRKIIVLIFQAETWNQIWTTPPEASAPTRRRSAL